MATTERKIIAYEPDLDGHLIGLLDRLAWCCREGDVLGRDRMLVRFIGQRLYDAGGVDLMRWAYYEVAEAVPRNGWHGFHPAKVQAAWDGIGTWRW